MAPKFDFSNPIPAGATEEQDQKAAAIQHMEALGVAVGAELSPLDDEYRVRGRGCLFAKDQVQSAEYVSQWKKENNLKHLKGIRVTSGMLVFIFLDKDGAIRFCTRSPTFKGQIGIPEDRHTAARASKTKTQDPKIQDAHDRARQWLEAYKAHRETVLAELAAKLKACQKSRVAAKDAGAQEITNITPEPQEETGLILMVIDSGDKNPEEEERPERLPALHASEATPNSTANPATSTVNGRPEEQPASKKAAAQQAGVKAAPGPPKKRERPKKQKAFEEGIAGEDVAGSSIIIGSPSSSTAAPNTASNPVPPSTSASSSANPGLICMKRFCEPGDQPSGTKRFVRQTLVEGMRQKPRKASEPPQTNKITAYAEAQCPPGPASGLVSDSQNSSAPDNPLHDAPTQDTPVQDISMLDDSAEDTSVHDDSAADISMQDDPPRQDPSAAASGSRDSAAVGPALSQPAKGGKGRRGATKNPKAPSDNDLNMGDYFDATRHLDDSFLDTEDELQEAEMAQHGFPRLGKLGSSQT
ncbi:hypothetical protein CMUS01_16250 [Colletotrichum musicola]|uniref:Uncharacterized protein n=1 Tax=Colletotrichum musicola TaxID=2175873 RepID=A0A8H6IQH4_9PEZI|nr:hypothetical protein CMUS01_16250 [Colletotrichum musicola]